MMTDHLNWDRYGNLDDYIAYRTRFESIAILTGAHLTHDMGINNPDGYATGIQVNDVWQQYNQDSDWNKALQKLDSYVINAPWQGGSDVNNDGSINQKDKFITQYPGGRQ